MTTISESRRTRRLHLARVVAWGVVGLYGFSMGASFWLGARIELPWLTGDIALLAGFGMFAVVGATLVAKRPANVVGWILIMVSLVSPVHVGDLYAAYVMSVRGEPDLLAVFAAWVNMWYWYLTLALAFVYLPLFFPDGKLPSRRWLVVAVVAGVGVFGTASVGAISETLVGTEIPYRIENPIGVEGVVSIEEMPFFAAFTFGLLGLGTVGAFVSVAVRFRRSRGIERQQMKWFLYVCAFIPSFTLLDFAPDIVGSVVFGAVIIALPLSIGVAVLRHNLYDIDVVINKTLVYLSLTATLVLVYLGGVVGSQFVVRVLTGSTSQIAVVASTLVVAALFNPLRRRTQTFIDRHFYRAKYDATKTLEAFSARLRDETSLETLSENLTTVVEDTLRPAHASLWLRPGDHSRQSSTRKPSNPP